MKIGQTYKKVRQPGVEPGSTAWKATMLTVTPLTLLVLLCENIPDISSAKFLCNFNKPSIFIFAFRIFEVFL